MQQLQQWIYAVPVVMFSCWFAVVSCCRSITTNSLEWSNGKKNRYIDTGNTFRLNWFTMCIKAWKSFSWATHSSCARTFCKAIPSVNIWAGFMEGKIRLWEVTFLLRKIFNRPILVATSNKGVPLCATTWTAMINQRGGRSHHLQNNRRFRWQAIPWVGQFRPKTSTLRCSVQQLQVPWCIFRFAVVAMQLRATKWSKLPVRERYDTRAPTLWRADLQYPCNDPEQRRSISLLLVLLSRQKPWSYLLTCCFAPANNFSVRYNTDLQQQRGFLRPDWY